MITRTPPWQKQKEAYDFCFDRTASMLNMVMGAGKTKVALDLIGNWGSDLVLVVCPKPAFKVWPVQVAKHWDPRWKNPNLIVDGSLPLSKRMRNIDQAVKPGYATMVVMNYEALNYGVVREWLLTTPWDVIVLDESHRIKAPGGKTSKFLQRLGRGIPRRLCLTGNAMDHSPLDIYAQCRFLDTSVFGSRFQDFKDAYCVMGGYQGREIVRFVNQEDMGRKFAKIAFIASEEDMPDLPPTEDLVLTAPLTGESLGLYKTLSKKFVAEVRGNQIKINNALTRVLRLKQIASGLSVNDEERFEASIGNDRAMLLQDFLQDIPRKEPLVVFYQFNPEARDIAEVVRKSGRKILWLSGSRDDYQEWVDGGGALVCQINSGKESLDFTNCRYEIYYGLSHSLGSYLQSRKRSHRPGQERKVVFVHLLMEGTIDMLTYKALQSRQDTIKTIMDWAAEGAMELRLT